MRNQPEARVCTNCSTSTMDSDQAFCGNCGTPLPSNWLPTSEPTRAVAIPEASSKQAEGRKALLGLLIAGAVFFGAYSCATSDDGGSGNSGRSDTPAASITGRYVGWEPVDDAHGYALIEVTNSGAASGTAKCTVEVSTDFADFGYDIIDEPIAAGQTERFRVPLTVQNNSAYNVSKGEVKDC